MTGKVEIALNGAFTAHELEDIIRSLAEARASIEPAVPTTPPGAGSTDEIPLQDEALFSIRTLAGGGLRIWLRSEGMGWMAFTLSPDQRQGLREFLGKEPGHTLTAH